MADQVPARSAPIDESIVIGKQGQTLSRQNSIYNTFPYTALNPSIDSTRLVILEPSDNKQGVVCCRLVHVTFSELPKYDALSYTWGSDVRQNAIAVDGKSFLVGDNLLDALIRLRKPEEERILWIDAICINQQDIPERNRQVRIMPHIYTRAQMVLVWLGEGATIDYGTNAITSAKSLFPSSKQRYLLNRAGLKEYPEVRKFLMGLCTVDYWNRVWIIRRQCNRLECLY
jgi:Heterokaryon incompatibility protein (HET)